MTGPKGFSSGEQEEVPVWYRGLQTFLMSWLKDEGGANAVKYALIMAVVADFIIAAVILIWWWLAP